MSLLSWLEKEIKVDSTFLSLALALPFAPNCVEALIPFLIHGVLANMSRWGGWLVGASDLRHGAYGLESVS